jgi:hypothetical protein
VSIEEIGTVDPQDPWEYLDRWFFHVQGAAGECLVRDKSEPSDLGLNSRQPLDLSRVAQGLKPHAKSSRAKVPKGLYRDIGVQKFRSPEDERPGTRHQKSRNCERI